MKMGGIVWIALVSWGQGVTRRVKKGSRIGVFLAITSSNPGGRGVLEGGARLKCAHQQLRCEATSGTHRGEWFSFDKGGLGRSMARHNSRRRMSMRRI